MTIALVTHLIAKSTNSNGFTSSSIDTTGASLLVLVLASYQAATEPTISDSKSNSWSQRTAYNDGTDRIRILYVANPTVGTGHTFTVTGSATYPAIAASSWSGVKTASPYDVENGGNGTITTSAATGSVTPSEDGELLIAAVSNDQPGAPGSPTVNNSFTILDSTVNVDSQAFGLAVAYRVQATAAAINPTITWTASADYAAAIASFKQAAAASVLPTATIKLQAVKRAAFYRTWPTDWPFRKHHDREVMPYTPNDLRTLLEGGKSWR